VARWSKGERNRLRIQASMDGRAAIAKSVGGKFEVSGMELITLCTFAELGLLSLWSSLEGQAGERAQEEEGELLDAIRENFSNGGRFDGLINLSQTCAAMLRSERFHRFVVPYGGQHNRPDRAESECAMKDLNEQISRLNELVGKSVSGQFRERDGKLDLSLENVSDLVPSPLTGEATEPAVRHTIRLAALLWVRDRGSMDGFLEDVSHQVGLLGTEFAQSGWPQFTT